MEFPTVNKLRLLQNFLNGAVTTASITVGAMGAYNFSKATCTLCRSGVKITSELIFHRRVIDQLTSIELVANLSETLQKHFNTYIMSEQTIDKIAGHDLFQEADRLSSADVVRALKVAGVCFVAYQSLNLLSETVRFGHKKPEVYDTVAAAFGFNNRSLSFMKKEGLKSSDNGVGTGLIQGLYALKHSLYQAPAALFDGVFSFESKKKEDSNG